MTQANYDVIVVGAGSAGAVVAARLSESGRTVLLLEAGPAWRRIEDIPPELILPGRASATTPGHPNNWSIPSEELPGLTMPIPRGKGLGGSSSINGAYFIRGTRHDFDEWSRRGNELWSYEKVLPAFRRSETDLDFSDEAHGTSGPITVSREPMDRAPEFTAAFTSACLELGFNEEPDKNADGAGGVGPVPMNIVDGRKISTAVGYLLGGASRPSLTITGNAHVERVLLANGRAVGVEAIVDGRRQRFTAGEVVLSAGALRSPQLLMLSGVGPEAHLRAHGIAVVHDSPAVGQNLADHPEVAIPYTIKAKALKSHERGNFTSALNWTAQGSHTPGDLEILPFVSKLGDAVPVGDLLKRPGAMLAGMRQTPWKVSARQMRLSRYAVILVSLQQQDSRGHVGLRSADPLAPPSIFKNLLSDPRDRERLREGARTAARLFDSRPLRDAGAKLIGVPPNEADDRTLDEFVAASFFVAGHPASTCRMGPSPSDDAVVDQHGRVYGIDGLRVVDGSIFPTITSRGPNASTIMVGERIAELMLSEGSSAGGGVAAAGAAPASG